MSQDLEQNEEALKPWIDPHKLKQISGTWWKGNQLVITADTPARRAIVQSHHDPPAYGHPGISRTTELVARRYWWPRMTQDVKDYVKGCADCQRNKVSNQTRRALLNPIVTNQGIGPRRTDTETLVTRETSAGRVPSIPFRFRAGRTAGNSRGHSLVQSPGVWEPIQPSMGKLYHNGMIR